MPHRSSIQSIVVLGGGYAGLRTVIDLTASCHRHGLERHLCLIDRSEHHQLVTHLHRAATEGMPLEECRLSFDGLLVPGSVERRRGKIQRLEPEGRLVHLAEGPPVSYDRLVIALGSVAVTPEIEGLEEHGFQLRWWQDAKRLREHIRRVFKQAANPESSDDDDGQRVTIVVVGGGATGCQLAGELAHWLPQLADRYGVAVDRLRLVLLEAGPRLLREANPDASSYARETLGKKGVEIRLDTPLARVSRSSLEFEGGDHLGAQAVIWTGGVEAPKLLAESGLPVGAQGRVRVDSLLRVEGHPEIYVAGDAALFEVQGAPLPATAAVAQHQGAFAAKILASEMLGRTISEYRPRDVGQLVSLGGDEAVGTMLGLPLQGSGAGFVKENIERWYESTVTRRLPLVDL